MADATQDNRPQGDVSHRHSDQRGRHQEPVRWPISCSRTSSRPVIQANGAFRSAVAKGNRCQISQWILRPHVLGGWVGNDGKHQAAATALMARSVFPGTELGLQRMRADTAADQHDHKGRMHAQARSDEGWQARPASIVRRDSAEHTPSGADTVLERERRTRLRIGRGIAGVNRFPARAESERALMRAVLVDAIRCVVGEVSPFTQRDYLAAEARRWIRSRDEYWPYSFEHICAGLDLEAERLRRLLLGPREVLKTAYGPLVARLRP